MQPNEFINGPGDLLKLAITIAGIGALLLLISNLIMKAMGMDLSKHVRETKQYYRNTGSLEHWTAFHSDARNIPPTIGAGGLLMLLGAALMALGSGVWFLFRVVSG